MVLKKNFKIEAMLIWLRQLTWLRQLQQAFCGGGGGGRAAGVEHAGLQMEWGLKRVSGGVREWDSWAGGGGGGGFHTTKLCLLNSFDESQIERLVKCKAVRTVREVYAPGLYIFHNRLNLIDTFFDKILFSKLLFSQQFSLVVWIAEKNMQNSLFWKR